MQSRSTFDTIARYAVLASLVSIALIYAAILAGATGWIVMPKVLTYINAGHLVLGGVMAFTIVAAIRQVVVLRRPRIAVEVVLPTAADSPTGRTASTSLLPSATD